MTASTARGPAAWELALVVHIARSFRTYEREELESELRRQLLTIKASPRGHVRDWHAYLPRLLHNRAADWIRHWRDLQARFVLFSMLKRDADANEDVVDMVAEVVREDPDLRIALGAVFDSLDDESRVLWRLLSEGDGNRSRLARRLRVHRNTIGHRLRHLQRILIHHGF